MHKVFKEGELKNVRHYVMTQRYVLVRAFGVFSDPVQIYVLFYALPHGSVLVPEPWHVEGVWFKQEVTQLQTIKIFRCELRMQCNVYGRIENLEDSAYAEHVFSENVQTIGIFS